VTQYYDVKTVEVATRARTAASAIAHQPLQGFTQASAAPKLTAGPELLGFLK